MNKNIKQVLVRVEYNNQIWFECMDISDVIIRWPGASIAITGRSRYFKHRLERSVYQEDRLSNRLSA